MSDRKFKNVNNILVQTKFQTIVNLWCKDGWNDA